MKERVSAATNRRYPFTMICSIYRLASEIVLTNRGSTEVTVDLTYTAAFGDGSGSARFLSLAGQKPGISFGHVAS